MPRIGLLSDSHGQVRITQQAVQTLLDHRATILLHLGDIGSIHVIDTLVGLIDADNQPVPVHIVFGNTDHDAASLAAYARPLGVMVRHPMGHLTLEDESILMFTHGDNPHLIQQALRQGCRYLCQGHTHRRTDTRHGVTRWINPGALHRAAEHSVAILDTTYDELTFYPILPLR